MRQPATNCGIVNNSGQITILAALFFLAVSLTMVQGIAAPILHSLSAAQALQNGNQSFYAAEGAAQDVLYRLLNGFAVDASETLSSGGTSATVTSAATADGRKVISVGDSNGYRRKSETYLVMGDGASFNYGVQAGAGGVTLENSSSIAGNVQSNGPVKGSGNNLIKGAIVSAGFAGKVEGVHVTSSTYAHTIQDSDIEGDAYFQVISGTTVGGALHPGSADQVASALPISDVQVSEWEADAAAGGVISSPCPYRITNTTTLGPKKIACDMEISGNGYTVTLNGPLWIAGNLTISNSPTIKVASSLGSASVAIIADNTANRTTSSKIISDNSAVFEGSGTSGSFVLLLSANRSAEDGGDETAIKFANSTSGALLSYAGHGEILLQNSVKLKEITAYKIRLKNSAEVKYETGLANLLFTSGPSGGYTIDSWKETE